ncbi:hypothetical protein U1Q18_022247 [Sarracenia purpurea var. burkii]
MSSSSGVNHLSQPCIYGNFVSSYGERKSRFMKWLSKLFRGGSDRGVLRRRHPQYVGEENMVWRAPVRSLDDRTRSEKEREELDRAIALSLAEDLKRPPGYKWQTDNNEGLMALQDNLNPPYPPYAPTDYYPRGYSQVGLLSFPGNHSHSGQVMKLFCFLHSHIWLTDLRLRVCNGCHHDIGYGNYLGCMGIFFHPECFCCRSCGFPITEHESWNARYISLEDGRSLCLECMESAIMDTGDCQPLYHAIRDYYEGMNMKLDQQIPMLLVERQALNEAIVGEKNVINQSSFTLYVPDLSYFSNQDKNLSRASITCLKQGVCAYLKSKQLPVYVG